MAKKRRVPGLQLQLDVDDRTEQMSDAALRCRARGHKWEEQALSRRRVIALVRQGQEETILYCERGCGATVHELVEIASGDVLKVKREYPEGGEYRMPPGSGRLRRSSARVASFARRYPELL